MATWIAIEGPDRVGKATQSMMLSNWLTRLGFNCKRVEVPFQDNKFGTYDKIYDMLLNGKAKSRPILFQLIQSINKFICQLYLLTCSAEIIVLDRWMLSSEIYGNATGIKSWIRKLLCLPLIKPDITLVLLKDKAYQNLDEQDAYEKDMSLQKQVNKLYADCVDNKNIIAIDADQDKVGVFNEILSELEPRLKKHNLYI